MPTPAEPGERLAAAVRGKAAEDLVSQRLCAGGFEVIARNWRGGGGELDVVARKGSRLRFVEVKSRREGEIDAPSTITRSKRRRLQGAAEAFLASYSGTLREVCFALAVVDGERVRWLDDPFSADGH